MSLYQDLRHQSRALLLGAGMILAGLGALGLAHLGYRDAQDTERQALAEKNAFQARIARISQEEKEIQAGDILFRRLAERGILGDEKRLDWIEHIARIRAERRLGDIRWEILPPRPLDAELAPGQAGEFEFTASTLRIQLALLHEEDLLRFISDLRDGMPAYVRVRQCSLSRTPAGGSKRWGQMQAECQLDLITLTRRPPAPKQP